MIAVPFSVGTLLAGGLSPLQRTPLPRSDTAPDFFEDGLVRRLQAIGPRDGFGATALHFLRHASSAGELWDQIDHDAVRPGPPQPGPARDRHPRAYIAGAAR
jgi:hypothetical protein